MSIPRNESCPCGSGKKYKRCHGALDGDAPVSPAAVRANALKVRDTELSDRLMRFARARYGPHWLHHVLDSQDLLIDGELPDTDFPIVIPWLEHFRVNPSGATLAEEWQRHEASRLSSDDRLLLES